MVKASISTVLFMILSISNAAKLPSYITPCSLSDPKLNECALKSALSAYPSVVKGDKAFKISSLAPLKLDQVIIDVGDSLQMKLYNLTITGIDTGVLDKVDIDPAKNEWNMQFTAKHLTMDLTYDIKGRILLLPIVGNGPGKLTLINPVFTYNFSYDTVTRKDNEYVNIVKSKLTYKPTKMTFHLENLFNGDPRLGETMNTFLNENWYEVNGEIGSSIEETMNSVVTSVIKNYLNRIPLQHLFTK